MQRLVALPVALIFAGAAACISVQQSETPPAAPADGLTAEDLHEIEELIQGGRVEGAAELKEFYANLRKTNTTRHVLSNLVIEPAPGEQ